MNENSLIKDIGRSYIVSSFIPAALFSIIAAFLFQGFTPAILQNAINSTVGETVGRLVIFSIFATWLGFALYSSWNWTVRIFEGYYFLRFPWLANQLKSRHLTRYSIKKKLVDDLFANNEKDQDNASLDYLLEFQKLDMEYPVSGKLLPTRLGNILRSSEEYSWSNYHISSIAVWPRLLHLMPKEFRDQVEETNNRYIFLLNSSLLSYLIAIAALILVLLRLPCYLLSERILQWGGVSWMTNFACPAPAPLNFFQRGFAVLAESEFLIVAAVFFIIGYGLYYAATVVAIAYSNLIRSSFDLYKFQLLETLQIARPDTLLEETELWQEISEFLIGGQKFSEGHKIDFEYIKLKKKRVSKSKDQPNV